MLGLSTRYDGRDNRCDAVILLCADHKVIPVCPEQLGGLATPRAAAEIQGGDGFTVLDGSAVVRSREGNDVTACFIRGAEQALLAARLARVDAAILKAASPSCGLEQIYDGTFQGCLREGAGVTAALLKRHRIPVLSETSLPSHD